MITTSISTLETTHNAPGSKTTISYELSQGGRFSLKEGSRKLTQEETLPQTFRTTNLAVIFEDMNPKNPSITISVKHFPNVDDISTTAKVRSAVKSFTVQKSLCFEPFARQSTPLSIELLKPSIAFSTETLTSPSPTRCVQKTFPYPFPHSVTIFCNEKEIRINPTF